MANVKVSMSGTEPRANIRPSLQASNEKSFLPKFLQYLGGVIGPFNPKALVQILNDDEAFASDTLTVDFDTMTDGDTVQIGAMILTAKVSGGGSPTAPNMGTLTSFAAVANSTITNTGNTILTGDLGLSPGTSVTGFPPGIVGGVQHIADSAAAQAQTDLTAAYTDLQGRGGATDESGVNLGTLTLGPGIYKFTSSAQLTGTLTLDAGGNPGAVWIFQIGSTLTTASSSVVSIINGGHAGNVFWQVGSSATLGTSTSFQGSILAQASITCNTSATILGRALARTGAVTLDTNTITKQPQVSGVTTLLPNQYFIGASDAATAINLATAVSTFSSGLLAGTPSGATVLVKTNVSGPLGNMLPVIIVQFNPLGMTSSGIALSGGANDTAVPQEYNTF